MANQICPWGYDLDSFHYEQQFQGSEDPLALPIDPPAKKIEKKARPVTANQATRNKKQKKITRPLSCQKSLAPSRKKERKCSQELNNLHYASSQEIRVFEKPIPKAAQNKIKIEFLECKRVANLSTLYSNYSSFKKYKVKRSERPHSILSKNLLQPAHKPAVCPQKSIQHISTKPPIDVRLVSALKLGKVHGNTIRSELAKYQASSKVGKPKQALQKRNGFVYYNRQLFDHFQTIFI